MPTKPEGPAQEPQKCTFKGCENYGIPQNGFDFFVCDDCFEEFDDALRAAYEDAR